MGRLYSLITNFDRLENEMGLRDYEGMKNRLRSFGIEFLVVPAEALFPSM